MTGLRHVAGFGMTALVVGSDILERTDLTPLEKLVLAYDEQNETPETSHKSTAENLGVSTSDVAHAREVLKAKGFTVENHTESDLTEDEYYV